MTPRSADDPQNVLGSGYNYGDAVTVPIDGEDIPGVVEAVHSEGKRIVVRLYQAGHRRNGSAITVNSDDLQSDAKPAAPHGSESYGEMQARVEREGLVRQTHDDLTARVAELEAGVGTMMRALGDLGVIKDLLLRVEALEAKADHATDSAPADDSAVAAQ